MKPGPRKSRSPHPRANSSQTKSPIRRAHSFYAELGLIVTIPLLIGAFLSLASDSKANWIFVSVVYLFAIIIQQSLFGEKHFDSQKFGIEENELGVKNGLFMFGEWVVNDTEQISEARRLMELSKISYQTFLIIAQVVFIGGYFFLVFKAGTMNFHLLTLIHLAAAIYLMLTTHKGHLFLALAVNLITVILALRNRDDAPAWLIWSTIPYALSLVHALVHLHDFDLKKLFEGKGSPWIRDPNRTIKKSRRVFLDLLPLVLFFLFSWKLLLKTEDQVSKKISKTFSSAKIPESLQKMTNDMVANSVEALNAQNNSSHRDLPSQSEHPTQSEQAPVQLDQLNDPNLMKGLGATDQKNLQELLSKISAPQGNPAKNPQGGAPAIDQKALNEKLSKLKQMLGPDPDDENPLDLGKASAPSGQKPEEDDVAGINTDIETNLKIREAMKNFGKESPTQTMERLKKLQQESPGQNLVSDLKNPSGAETSQASALEAQKILEDFAKNSPSKAVTPEEVQRQLTEFQSKVMDPDLREKTQTMLKQMQRTAAPKVEPPKVDFKVLESFFEKIFRLVPWIGLGLALYLLSEYFKKLKKPTDEELEALEEIPIEIEKSELDRLKSELRQVLAEKKLSNNEKVIKSYNLALELMRSLNYPKPDGMPAENFPGTFPKVIHKKLSAPFDNVTQVFAFCFYGKILVEDSIASKFDRHINQIFHEALYFQVKNRSNSSEPSKRD